MQFIKTLPRAGAWVGLFIGSSFAVTIFLLTYAILTNNEYIMSVLDSYQAIIDAVNNGTTIENIISSYDTKKMSDFILLVTVLSYIPVLIVAGLKSVRSKGMYKKFEIDTLSFVIFAAAFFNFVIETLLNIITPYISSSSASTDLQVVNMMALSGSPVITFIVVGIFAPIVEEIILRRGVQRSIQEFNPVVAILIASISFGLLHGNLIQGTVAMVFGLLLGFVYYRTDNLVYSTCMHMVINLSACTLIVLGLDELWFYFAVVLLFAFIFLLIRRRKKRTLSEILSKRTFEGVSNEEV